MKEASDQRVARGPEAAQVVNHFITINQYIAVIMVEERDGVRAEERERERNGDRGKFVNVWGVGTVNGAAETLSENLAQQ